MYADYLKREDTYIAFHHDRLTNEKRPPVERRDELAKLLTKARERLASRENDDTRDALMALEKRISDARHARQDVTRVIGQREGQILFIERQIEEKQKKQSQNQLNLFRESRLSGSSHKQKNM